MAHRSTRTITIFCTLFALASFSCRDTGMEDQHPIDGSIFFEIEAVNFAWGYVYQGTAIDPEGNVYTYNPGVDKAPVLFHADGLYTKEELADKYQHARHFVKQIPDDSLRWLKTTALLVSTNAYSYTMINGADMGAIEYSTFIYRPQFGKFQKIILCLNGDSRFYNQSGSAIVLTMWLKNLTGVPLNDLRQSVHKTQTTDVR